MFELIRSIRIDDERAIGTAEIAATHPMLADHFDDRPILPGSWLIELAAQIAGPLVEATAFRRDALDRCALLAMVEHAKFLAPVDLPAVIRIEATIARVGDTTMTARTVTVRDGVQVSRRYPGGVALRFARVRGYRPDKDPVDADTIDTVRGLL